MKTLSVLQPICCTSDAQPLERDAAEALAATFKALSDPTRVAIVNRLAAAECCVCDLTAAFDLSQPTVSHHLRVLRDAGLVEARVDGPRRIYSLRPEPLAEVDAWLEPYRQFWRGKLSSLQRHLDRDN